MDTLSSFLALMVTLSMATERARKRGTASPADEVRPPPNALDYADPGEDRRADLSMDRGAKNEAPRLRLDAE